MVSWWLGGCPWYVGWGWSLVGWLRGSCYLVLCHSLRGDMPHLRGSAFPQSALVFLGLLIHSTFDFFPSISKERERKIINKINIETEFFCIDTKHFVSIGVEYACLRVN